MTLGADNEAIFYFSNMISPTTNGANRRVDRTHQERRSYICVRHKSRTNVRPRETARLYSTTKT